MKDDRSLRGHPDLMRLSRKLRMSEMATIGLLHCAWWWVEEYVPDGDVSYQDKLGLVEWLGWEGSSKHLLDALQACGVLNGRARKD